MGKNRTLEHAGPFARDDRDGVRVWRFTGSATGTAVYFTERLGGFSEPPYGSLNLGYHVGDDPAAVTRNRELLASKLGIAPGRITCPRQQHTAAVVELADESRVGTGAVREESEFDPCDGLMTTLRAAPILLHFADCAPVVMSATNTAGEPVVAVIHAGRQGLVSGVVENGAKLLAEAAAISPETIIAAVGPAIGSCCYEVGVEIADEFEERFGPENMSRSNGEGIRLDIQGAANRVLQAAGLLPENIHVLKICTACNENFFSYRRDGVTGRHGAIAWIG